MKRKNSAAGALLVLTMSWCALVVGNCNYLLHLDPVRHINNTINDQ